MRIVESWIRRKVFRQRPYLIDRWTVVEDEVGEAHYGIDLMEGLTQALVRNTDKKFMDALND